MKAIAFVAPSGTGKTTCIERLVAELSSRGLKVGVLKHDGHRLAYDKPGKDTWRFRQAGAWRAVISGDREVAVFAAPADPSVEALIATWFAEADLVLVEGYRGAGLPTVRVHRKDGPPTEGWEEPANVVAWFTDDGRPGAIALDDTAAQADWILRA